MSMRPREESKRMWETEQRTVMRKRGGSERKRRRRDGVEVEAREVVRGTMKRRRVKETLQRRCECQVGKNLLQRG